MTVRCLDCGVEYGTLGLDLVLPDQQWKAICPEDGILCANCICKRAAKFGGTAILAWVDTIDRSLVPGHWQSKRAAEQIITPDRETERGRSTQPFGGSVPPTGGTKEEDDAYRGDH